VARGAVNPILGARAKRRPTAAPLLAAGDDVPLHERVKRHVSEHILMGAWAPGTTLPGEEHLAAALGVAVGTVRRGLADLVAEGMISRRPKVGTVVTGRAPHHSLRFYFQYFRLHGLDGSLVRSQTKTLAIVRRKPSRRDAQLLGIGVDADVIEIERVRSVGGRPVMRDAYTLPAARVPGFPERPEALPPLLYAHLLQAHGIRVSAVREEIRADLATAEDRRLLALPKPASVLVMDLVMYDQTGAAALIGLHRATTRAHRYVNEVR
jgi:GntR family transcriptional regulator